MSFKDLLLLAKENDPFAIDKILERYKPLLIKQSIINGVFDEDLHELLTETAWRCIQAFDIK